MFYLSFLIRDGKCALELHPETREPMICMCSLCTCQVCCFLKASTVICEAPSEEDYASGELKKRQLVMELDMATWRVREYNLTLNNPNA